MAKPYSAWYSKFKNNPKYDTQKIKYTFYSDGNSYDFDPVRNTNYSGVPMTLLELHKSEVRFRNSKSCFILDETGRSLRV